LTAEINAGPSEDRGRRRGRSEVGREGRPGKSDGTDRCHEKMTAHCFLLEMNLIEGNSYVTFLYCYMTSAFRQVLSPPVWPKRNEKTKEQHEKPGREAGFCFERDKVRRNA
jgi:hypothetical protein